MDPASPCPALADLRRPPPAGVNVSATINFLLAIYFTNKYRVAIAAGAGATRTAAEFAGGGPLTPAPSAGAPPKSSTQVIDDEPQKPDVRESAVRPIVADLIDDAVQKAPQHEPSLVSAVQTWQEASEAKEPEGWWGWLTRVIAGGKPPEREPAKLPAPGDVTAVVASV